MAERIIGIDFGTSTSVIRVKRYENGKTIGEKLETKEVIFGGIGASVPTLIQKKDDDESITFYGYEAAQKRRKYTTYHSFKVDLESSDPDKRMQARALTEEFFCYLAKVYKDQSNGGHLGNPDDKERTVVSYPVKWSEDTRKFMLEAARKAGFPNVTGTDEAQAAIKAVTVMSEDHLRKNGLLMNGTPSNILLIDMGAGTTDLVLCRYTPGENANAEIISTWPKDGEILFGGKEVDSLLQNFFRDMLDEDDAQLVFKRVGVDKFKSWKEETVSPALLKCDSVSDFDALDTCIEMADIEMDEYSLDRAGFEKWLGDYLKQLPELINGCIENAGIKGSDVDLVIVTGGHSQWYFVRDMLAGKMPQFGSVDLPKIMDNPNRIIPITRPQETVALGLVYSYVASVAVPGSQPTKTKHAVFSVHSTLVDDEKVTVTGQVCGNEPLVDFEHLAVYNDNGDFLGDCKAYVFEDDANVGRVTADSKNVTIELTEFTGEICGDVDIEYLISMPVDENTYDQAIADLEDDGCFVTRVKYEYENPNMQFDLGDAYFFYVTEIKDGKIFGRSIAGEMNSEHLKQYVYRKGDHTNGFRQKLNWENHTVTGHNAFFEADCSNVRVGDIITDCILPDGYTFKGEQISSWRYYLTIARLNSDNDSRSAGARASAIIREYFNKYPDKREINGLYYGMVPNKLRNKIGVPNNETILYSFDSTILKTQGAGSVVTENGIYHKVILASEFISWEDIENANEITLFPNGTALGVMTPRGYKTIYNIDSYNAELRDLWEAICEQLTGKKCKIAGK